jgi:hypothetical protein
MRMLLSNVRLGSTYESRYCWPSLIVEKGRTGDLQTFTTLSGATRPQRG